ncbi:hypothetical protein OROHE_015438 [Orobanche hederae]
MATEAMEIDHERTPVVRKGHNDRGRRRLVLANHFQVTVNPPSDGCCFYAYTVTIKHSGKGVLVCLESLRRQILDKLLESKEFAYDGESSLFTVATPLFPEIDTFNGTVNDLYDVSIVFDKMIPINGGDDGVGEEQFRVFDAILKQSAIKDGCFVIGRTRSDRVLCDKKVPLKLKDKFYRSAIRSAMLYGSECWAMKKSLESKLEVAEMRMLRWSCGRTLLDKIPNEVFRYALEVSPILTKCNVLTERSESGLTNSTYTELTQLYEKYKDQVHWIE